MAGIMAGIKRCSVGHFLTIFSAWTAPVPSAGFGSIMREKKERRKVMCAPSAEEADIQVECSQVESWQVELDSQFGKQTT